ncbi:MAG: virulence-associated E family protein, partial [Myxococcales bacterium]|nr:virulence-associated E family protein [Myxococcales bacterium]
AWDHERRLDTRFPKYLGADDTRINKAFGAKWMISAVARSFDPGCQVDHTPVLCGPQGSGKSSACRALVPSQDYFNDNLPAALGSKDAADYLQGLWIVELSELDSYNRAEMATAKAFLTRRTDRYRAAYARRTESHGRRCVFIGTTNEDAYLRDSTGNRRFWPVSVGQVRLDELARDRDPLWAEAVARYRAGEQWHLTDQRDVSDAIDAQQERFVVDAWEPKVEEYLGTPTTTGPRKQVTVTEVLESALGLKLHNWGQAEQNRVARVLVHLGWERKQIREPDGKRKWHYQPPGGGI